MTTIDTTLPGVSASLEKAAGTASTTLQGRIAVIGKFEKGDGNIPYFVKSEAEAYATMGNDPDYSGTKIIEEIFKPTNDGENLGANSAILVKAGATTRASATLVDTTTPTAVNTIKLEVTKGGAHGNDYSVAIANGTIHGKMVILKYKDTIIDSFDNLLDTQAVVDKINSTIDYITATALDATKTLKNTSADIDFTGGTEVAEPTTTDLDNALHAIEEESFEGLILTDIPSTSYFASIIAYLNLKFSKVKPCWTIQPIPSNKTIAEAVAISLANTSMFLSFINQDFTINNEKLDTAQSAARYAGYIAGLPINVSPTNKNIDDIELVTKKDDLYTQTDSGITTFKLRNHEENKYKVVSAVTSSQERDTEGKKIYNEFHAIRCFVRAVHYLDLEEWAGDNNTECNPDTVSTELEKRKEELIEANVITDLEYSASIDEDNSKVVNVPCKVHIGDLIKHIHYDYEIAVGE